MKKFLPFFLLFSILLIPAGFSLVRYETSLTNTGTITNKPVQFHEGTNGTVTLNANRTAANISLQYANASFDPILNISSIAAEDYYIKLQLVQIDNVSNFNTLWIYLKNSSENSIQVNITSQEITLNSGPYLTLGGNQCFLIALEEEHVNNAFPCEIYLNLIVRRNLFNFYHYYDLWIKFLA